MANKSKPPMKICKACGEKTHVRNRNCTNCGEAFNQVQKKPGSTEETVDLVLKAMELVQKLGEDGAIRLVRQVASKTESE